jgi:hypothetical protein
VPLVKEPGKWSSQENEPADARSVLDLVLRASQTMGNRALLFLVEVAPTM